MRSVRNMLSRIKKVLSRSDSITNTDTTKDGGCVFKLEVKEELEKQLRFNLSIVVVTCASSHLI